MECNKEEAIRAKGMAEKSMENRDFLGAQKFALKAQQLHPDLENISQIIMVCDVHCSAEHKGYGNEKDWYGILKVEPTADEASIKKQYRKFALLLHPDKNKFAGAADAFKLIGEAQKILLDREKRSLYDTRRQAASRSQVSRWSMQQTNQQSNVVRPPWVQNNFVNNATPRYVNQQSQKPQQQVQSGTFTTRPTFWTVCPFCSVRYQYYKDVLNKLLWCQSCRKSFTGYEMNAPGAATGSRQSQPAFPQQRDFQAQKSEFRTQNTSATSTSGSTFQSDNGSDELAKDLHMRNTFKASKGFKHDGKCGHVGAKSYNAGTSQTKEMRSNKRRKMVVESSESSDSESSGGLEEDLIIEGDSDNLAGQRFKYSDKYPRRSTRSKQHVSYNEYLSDEDEMVNLSRRSKQSSKEPKASSTTKGVGLPAEVGAGKSEMKDESLFEEVLQNGEKKIEKASEEVDNCEDVKKGSANTFVPPSVSSPSPAIEPETLDCPDPDFSNFDKDREEECFKVGQMWAVYDSLGAMPRYYALIRKVFSPGFKLKIAWLEADPTNEDEMKWVDEGLPVSCGNFMLGKTQNTEDLPMFSHLVHWEKGSRKNTYKIYPQKGETWAIFRHWDIKWYSDPVNKRKFEYDFVEVVSDYADHIGVNVRFLGKVTGFACLFRRMVNERDSVVISSKEMFRFSHKVPSFVMTGDEREDVPEGSYELDPASLPANHEGIAIFGSSCMDGEESIRSCNHADNSNRAA